MEHLDNLLKNAKEEAQPKDGTFEIALSLAAVSKQITVTLKPFTIRPEDVFLKTFANFGIDEGGVDGFKSNLQHLLPKIASSIALLPNDPSNNIGKVAETVRLWLLRGVAS